MGFLKPAWQRRAPYWYHSLFSAQLCLHAHLLKPDIALFSYCFLATAVHFSPAFTLALPAKVSSDISVERLNISIKLRTAIIRTAKHSFQHKLSKVTSFNDNKQEWFSWHVSVADIILCVKIDWGKLLVLEKLVLKSSTLFCLLKMAKWWKK